MLRLTISAAIAARRSRCAALALPVALAAIALGPSEAAALRYSPEQVQAITEQVRRGAPVPAQCGETCTALRETELTANTRSTPAWKRVIEQVNKLRARAPG